MYGTTSGSGVNNLGAVYRFHPTTYQFQIVHEFSAVIDGTTPTGGLCEVTNGQLVGFCAEGGQYNNGLVYSLSLSNHSFSSLYSLNSTTTGKPEIGNGPVKLTDGTLIAVLSSGGDNDQGSLIFWDLLNAAPNKLYDFDSNSGSNPQGRICIHSNHSWYWQLNDFNGTTRLMEYNPLSPSLTVAVDSIAGGGLHGRPLELSSGELMLLSGTGNHYYGGELHSYHPTTQLDTFISLHFKSQGARPIAPLCKASDGNYYGLASIGAYPINDLGYGAVFRYDPISQHYTLLSTFENTTVRGATGAFVEALPGKLFAIVVGNQGGRPRIIQYDYQTNQLSVVVNFSTTDGNVPSNTLCLASNGKLYGTTTFGGGSGSIGTLFEFDPVSLQFSTRYRFIDQTIGAQPYGELIQVAPDKLLGTSLSGGFQLKGTIYEYTLSTGAVSVKQTFSTATGSNPYAGLTAYSGSVFYGTCSSGGIADEGAIYRYDYSSNTLQNVASFGAFGPNQPYCKLTKASDGNLYGVTNAYASITNPGALFRFNVSNQSLQLIRVFEGNEGYGAEYNHQLNELNAVLTSAAIPQPLCPGYSFYLKYSCANQFASNHLFTAELSDSNGQFNSAQIIGTKVSAVADSMLVTLPASIAPGNNYRIRVKSADGSLIFCDNGTNLIINAPASITLDISFVGAPPVCDGDSVFVQAVLNGNNSNTTIHWEINNQLINQTGAYLSGTNLNHLDVVSAEVQVLDGCYAQSNYSSNTLTVSQLGTLIPSATILAQNPFYVCEGNTDVLTATTAFEGNAPTYAWYIDNVLFSSNAVSIDLPSDLSVGAHAVRLDLTSSLSCANPAIVESNGITVTVHAPELNENYISIVQGDSVFVEGQWLYTAGDNTSVYTDIFGCDSTVVTHLDVVLSAELSTIENEWIFTQNGIDQLIYFGNNTRAFHWQIIDITGRCIAQGNAAEKQSLYTQQFISGMYILRMQTPHSSSIRKWIVEN